MRLWMRSSSEMLWPGLAVALAGMALALPASAMLAFGILAVAG